MMRYLFPYLEKDLSKKMIFIGGPRQVGKTTLAQQFLKQYPGVYYNWDRPSDKKSILQENWKDEDELVIFDEIHKYPKWKNLIKGYYDTGKDKHKFIVTGSARLDVYKKGGDSLMGRYHYWRLHPFTLDEIPLAKISPKAALKRLMKVGGFPEPFLDNNEREARRWREERYEKIIRDDIRDLENIKSIQQMSLCLDLLRERVGGEIVVSNLAGDLQVSPNTVTKWIELFERMYLVFRVRSYTKNMSRAVQKPFKIFFFDNADVIGDEGAVFENLVATHLLKRCHFLKDYRGERWELGFLRDRENHEVDFILIKDGVVQELIEAKWADQSVSKSLVYYGEKLKAPQLTQIIGDLENPYTKGKFRMAPVLWYFNSKQSPYGLNFAQIAEERKSEKNIPHSRIWKS